MIAYIVSALVMQPQGQQGGAKASLQAGMSVEDVPSRSNTWWAQADHWLSNNHHQQRSTGTPDSRAQARVGEAFQKTVNHTARRVARCTAEPMSKSPRTGPTHWNALGRWARRGQVVAFHQSERREGWRTSSPSWCSIWATRTM